MRILAIVACALLALPGHSQHKYDTVPNVPDHYVRMSQKYRSEPVSEGHILFLGNSITEGGKWRRLLKDSSVMNRGISGDNTFGVIKRIDEITRHKPSKVFLLIGVNDLSKSFPNADVIENIFAIVGMIKSGSPKTTIIVQSILPVNPNVKGFPKQFSKQSDILEINGQLSKYGDKLKYTYADIHSAFLDKNNMLDEQFTYDGLHLNEAGYVHWVEYLKKIKLL